MELNGNLHESEATGPSGLVVLHHNAVDDFTVAAEVSLQAVLSRFPAQSADEKFPDFTIMDQRRHGKGRNERTI